MMMRSGFAIRAWHVGLALALGVALSGCDKVPLVAPTNSVVTLTAGTQTLGTGGTTTLSAFVTESNGSAVQNGTSVQFTTTLGTVDPQTALTTNGVATATFHAGTASGVAQVTAMSGGIGGASSSSSGTGTGGTTTTTTTSSNVVNITIGAAAVKTVVVSASPSAVPSTGGTVSIIGSAIDANGNRLSGISISFSTDVGSLSASSAVTDANGNATVQLTTSQAATVTANAGNAVTATVKVTVNPSGSVTLSVTPNPATVKASVTATVTPPANTNPHVVLDWGDGTKDDLGVLTASTARTDTHTYSSTGTYLISATSTVNGETFTTSTSEVVNPQPAIAVTVSSSSASPAQNTAVTFTATTSGDTTASIASYHWVITKGTDTSAEFDVTTTGNSLTETFTSSGTRTIVVTATTTDGRTGNGQTQVVVQ